MELCQHWFRQWLVKCYKHIKNPYKQLAGAIDLISVMLLLFGQGQIS